jgi:hypothetical protein
LCCAGADLEATCVSGCQGDAGFSRTAGFARTTLISSRGDFVTNASTITATSRRGGTAGFALTAVGSCRAFFLTNRGISLDTTGSTDRTLATIQATSAVLTDFGHGFADFDAGAGGERRAGESGAADFVIGGTVFLTEPEGAVRVASAVEASTADTGVEAIAAFFDFFGTDEDTSALCGLAGTSLRTLITRGTGGVVFVFAGFDTDAIGLRSTRGRRG